MGRSSERAYSGPGAHAWLIALSCGLAYALVASLLRQHSLYGDGALILEGAHSAETRSDAHLAYHLALGALLRWLGPQGIHAHAIGLALSIGGTSLGLALLCRAALLLGASRGASVLLTAAVGSSPAVLFFATTVEVHGFFFAWIGASALATVWAARAPQPARLAVLGLVTGSAYFAHATGHLLPLLALVLLAAHARTRGEHSRLRALARLALPLLLAHVASVSLLTFGLRAAGIEFDPGAGWAYLELCARRHGAQPELFPTVIWNEWLRAHAPWSFAALGAFGARALRPYTLALHLALAAYLALCFLMLATLDERGAYTLPLALPAVALGLLHAPRWLGLAAVLASATLALARIRTHDEPERLAAWESGCTSVLGEAPALLLVGGGTDLETCLVRMPERAFLAVGKLALTPDGTRSALLAHAHHELDTRLRAGERLVLTREAEQLLLAGRAHGRSLGADLLAALRARYEFRPLESGSFAGHELSLR